MPVSRRIGTEEPLALIPDVYLRRHTGQLTSSVSFRANPLCRDDAAMKCARNIRVQYQVGKPHQQHRLSGVAQCWMMTRSPYWLMTWIRNLFITSAIPGY